MKIKDLENYGIPSYVLDIWKKHYSPYLLPLQEEAVRNYGVLGCEKNEDKEGRMLYAPTEEMDSRLRGNDKKEDRNDIRKVGNDRGEGSTVLPRCFAPCNDIVANQNLLVIAPTSSGKTFLGEMAALSQVIHHKKSIFLVPSRALAEEKYWHFKSLYGSCGLEATIFSRDRKENDCRIIRGDYKLAVMSCEKFTYFLLKYPEFLTDNTLVVIDEMQMINNPKWGPLLEDVVDQLLKKDLINFRIIALSALIENQEALLKWFPAHPLISYRHPVEMRKGIVREGVFKYTTSKKKTFKREIFFKPDAVRDNCFEDYLLETVKYFIKKGEPTLIFFATCAETRKWAGWLASRLESPAASSAIEELRQMEETLSREELLELLEKGVAYHNRELSWEERNLVETYLKKGEIKVVCAAATLAMGINLPFKNIIVPLDKMHNYDESYRHNYLTGLNFTDIENMSGRAGILNFGRVIFLAYSLLSETIFQNIYFNCSRNNNQNHKGSIKYPLKKENDLPTFLLRLILKHSCRSKKIKKYLKEGAARLSAYWQFSFNKENIDEEIDRCLNILKEHKLINRNKEGVLSPTANGILINAKKIKVETYLFLKNWMGYCKKGEISELEILLLLAFSADGRALPIPPSRSYRDDYKKGSYNRGCSWRGNYRNKLLYLVFEQGDEDKKFYQNKLVLKKGEEEVETLEDYQVFIKTHLLYDWIKGSKDIKTIEREYDLCRSAIQRMGEGFSWLADSLMEIAENEGWKTSREEDLNKIKILSNRLIDGVEEEGLSLAGMHIPGLSRYYIRRLVGAGYGDEECLKEASEGELNKILPKRLVKRIQERIKEEKVIQEFKRQKLIAEAENCEPEPAILPSPLKTTNTTSASHNLQPASAISPAKTENYVTQLASCTLQPILEIDQHRPDRIIFEGKEVKLTPLAFSLVYLLAQNPKEVLVYEYLINTIWKESEDATYTQVTFHLSKIRRAILKTIGKNKKNKEKVKNILKVISRRGIMLNLAEDKLKIN